MTSRSGDQFLKNSIFDRDQWPVYVTSDQFYVPLDQFLMTSDQLLVISDQFYMTSDQFHVPFDQCLMTSHQLFKKLFKNQVFHSKYKLI